MEIQCQINSGLWRQENVRNGIDLDQIWTDVRPQGCKQWTYTHCNSEQILMPDVGACKSRVKHLMGKVFFFICTSVLCSNKSALSELGSCETWNWFTLKMSNKRNHTLNWTVPQIQLQNFCCKYKLLQARHYAFADLTSVFLLCFLCATSIRVQQDNVTSQLSLLPCCSLNKVDIICACVNQAMGGWVSAWLVSGWLAAANVPIWLWLLLSHVRQVVVFCCSLMGTAWPMCCLPFKR